MLRMKISNVLSILAILTLWLIAVPAQASNIVLNGNFDANSPAAQTAPVDWTLIPAASGSDFFVGAGPEYGAYSDPNSANFGAVGSLDDTLEQVLPTTPGQGYVLDFFLAHAETDEANDFSVYWNGTQVLSLVNEADFGYTEYTFNVTATSSFTTLEFVGREVPSWYDLDNVSVTSAVPEPTSLLLLGSGLAGIGLAAWRRKK